MEPCVAFNATFPSPTNRDTRTRALEKYIYSQNWYHTVELKTQKQRLYDTVQTSASLLAEWRLDSECRGGSCGSQVGGGHL